ncbi:hypothetical protein BDW75DRAFT_73922 [Aspergillus navahoensis]
MDAAGLLLVCCVRMAGGSWEGALEGSIYSPAFHHSTISSVMSETVSRAAIPRPKTVRTSQHPIWPGHSCRENDSLERNCRKASRAWSLTLPVGPSFAPAWLRRTAETVESTTDEQSGDEMDERWRRRCVCLSSLSRDFISHQHSLHSVSADLSVLLPQRSRFSVPFSLIFLNLDHRRSSLAFRTRRCPVALTRKMSSNGKTVYEPTGTVSSKWKKYTALH